MLTGGQRESEGRRETVCVLHIEYRYTHKREKYRYSGRKERWGRERKRTRSIKELKGIRQEE